VAVIEVSPEGVTVHPVMDITKIGLAALATLGSIFMMGAKLRRMRRMR
jgi:hypothetical protein